MQCFLIVLLFLIDTVKANRSITAQEEAQQIFSGNNSSNSYDNNDNKYFYSVETKLLKVTYWNIKSFCLLKTDSAATSTYWF